jgi:hypothetical protein
VIDTYVVAYVTENTDLYHETFYTYDEAKAFVDDREDKCLIVKIENVCDAGIVPASITVEDHT